MREKSTWPKDYVHCFYDRFRQVAFFLPLEKALCLNILCLVDSNNEQI